MDKMIYTLSYDTKQNHRARVFLCFLLVFCMVGSFMVQPVESHASVTLTGLACSAVVGLTIGALLAGSGVPMTEENSVSLINAFYWGCDAEQLAIIESFSPGQAIGNLLEPVSGFFAAHLNSGNLFFSRSEDHSVIFPKVHVSGGSNGSMYWRFTDSFGNPVDYFNAGDSFSFWGCPLIWKDLNWNGSDYWGVPTIVLLDGSELALSSSCRAIKPMYRYAYYPYSFTRLDDGSFSFHGEFRYSSWSAQYDYLTISPGDSRFPAGTWDYINMVYTNSFKSTELVGVTTPLPEYLPTSTDTEKALVTTTPVYVPQTWEQLWDSTPQDIREGTFTGGEVINPDVPVNPDLPLEGSTSGTISGEGSGTGVFEGVGSWVMDIPILGNILALLNQIWSIIQNLFTSIIGSIVSALENFFLPTEAQFVGFVEDIHDTVDASGFPSLDSALDFGDGRRPDNLQLTVYGKTVDIVPYDLVDYALEEYFRPIIRGLIWFLLVFYEVNQFSMLFTGRRLFDVASAFGNSKDVTSDNQKRGLIKL